VPGFYPTPDLGETCCTTAKVKVGLMAHSARPSHDPGWVIGVIRRV
jgi:hypothetical protein